VGGVNVLIWGDTETSPALRHEVPLAIGDAFLYIESDDTGSARGDQGFESLTGEFPCDLAPL
jgi:hypothetical protein